MREIILNFKLKIKNSCLTKSKQAGMSYIELIVVLSIFAVMSSIVLFNYGEFQAKVDIKNLASDIALKIVQAQKASISGLLPTVVTNSPQSYLTWKPSYGFYVNLADNKSFVYFVDLDKDALLLDPNCTGSGECLEKVLITKGNYISRIDVFYQDATTAQILDATISFSRPNSGAIVRSSQISNPPNSPVSYVKFTIASVKTMTAIIKLYASGRIQIN